LAPLHHRVDLLRREVEVLAEREPEDVQILPTVLERREDMAEDLPVLYVIGIDQDNPVWNRENRSFGIAKCANYNFRNA